MRAALFLCVGGTIVAAIFLEIALRLFPTRDTQVNNPYQYTRLEGHPIVGRPFEHYREIYPMEFDPRSYYRMSAGVIDYFSDQFGGRWITAEKRLLSHNVAIAVGDSFTYGFGLRYSDSFIYLLSKRFPTWDFVNFARPAFNSIDAMRLYEEKKTALPHKLLLYGMNLNDLIEFPASYFITNPMIGTGWAKHSKLVDFVLRKWDGSLGRSRRIQEIIDPAARERPFFRENFQAILKMRDLTKAKNIGFVVVVLPVLVDLEKRPFASVFSAIVTRLRQEGIQVIDLSTIIAGGRDSDFWITPFDQHPNEVANRIFADRISNELKD
jgi:hypothetical protein